MRFVLLALLLLPVTAVAELYQWRDDQGRVHYGERPPAPGKVDASRVRELEPPDPPRFRPRREGAGVYCGSQPVPDHYPGDAEGYVLFLARYLQSQTKWPMAGLEREERRCLEGWARAELTRYEDVELALLAEHRRLVAQLHDRATGRDTRCPAPAGGWLVGEEARAWADCHLPADRSIRTLRQRLKYLQPLVDLRGRSAGDSPP